MIGELVHLLAETFVAVDFLHSLVGLPVRRSSSGRELALGDPSFGGVHPVADAGRVVAFVAASVGFGLSGSGRLHPLVLAFRVFGAFGLGSASELVLHEVAFVEERRGDLVLGLQDLVARAEV